MPTFLPFLGSYAPSFGFGENPYVSIQPQREAARQQYAQNLQTYGFAQPFSGFSGGMAPMYGGFQYAPRQLPQFQQPQIGPPPPQAQQPQIGPPPPQAETEGVTMPADVPAGPGGYFGIMDYIRSLRGQTGIGGGAGGGMMGGGQAGALGTPPQQPQLTQPVTQPAPAQTTPGSITEEERSLMSRLRRRGGSAADYQRQRDILQRLNVSRQPQSPLVAQAATRRPMAGQRSFRRY